jgi:hypothetical protein
MSTWWLSLGFKMSPWGKAGGGEAVSPSMVDYLYFVYSGPDLAESPEVDVGGLLNHGPVRGD